MKKVWFIIKAYAKWIAGLATGKTSEKAIDRYLICQKCNHKKHGFCKLCGCVVRVKCSADYIEIPATRKTVAGCPAGKW